MLQAFLCTGAETVTSMLRNVLEEGRLFETNSGRIAATALEDASTASDYDLFVIYHQPSELSATAWINVLHSIETGAGALLLDSQSPLETMTPAISPGADLDAAEFATTHIRLTAHHPITRGLRGFDCVTAIPRPNSAGDGESAIATAAIGDGDPSPALMVSRFGRGRIARVSVRFDPAYIANFDPVRRMIGRCAEWACAGNVIDF